MTSVQQGKSRRQGMDAKSGLEAIKADEHGDREHEARVLLRGKRRGATAAPVGLPSDGAEGFRAVRAVIFQMLDAQLNHLKQLRDRAGAPEVWNEEDADVHTLVMHAHQQLAEIIAQPHASVDELNVNLGMLSSLFSVAKRSYSQHSKAYWYQLSYTSCALLVAIEMLELADGGVQ